MKDGVKHFRVGVTDVPTPYYVIWDLINVKVHPHSVRRWARSSKISVNVNDRNVSRTVMSS